MIKFEQVPPPERLPVNQIGETLGLCHGLRTQAQSSQWRCHQCSKMLPSGSLLVWVPDGVRVGDPAWSVEESARRYFMNGSLSGWCVGCAPKAPKPPVAAAESLLPAAWWRRLFKRIQEGLR